MNSALTGAVAREIILQKPQGEIQGFGVTQPNTKGQSYCDLHISILRRLPTLQPIWFW